MEIVKQMTSRVLLAAVAAITAVVAIIVVLPAALASAQQPQLPPPQSTYEAPLPLRVANDRYQSIARSVVRECVNTRTTEEGEVYYYEIRRPLTDRCIELFKAQTAAVNDVQVSWITASVGFFDYDRTAPLGTYGVGLCTDLVTGEDRTIDAVPEGRRWHAWSSGTVCWDRNDDGDFDDAGEIGSLLMDE